MAQVRIAEVRRMSMRVLLDGRPIRVEGSSLGTALEAIARASTGRLVVDLRADGEPVPSVHLSNPPATDPYAQELHATTTDVQSAMTDALLAAAEALERADSLHGSAAVLLQQGRVPDALRDLSQALNTWEEVRRTIELTSDPRDAGGSAFAVGPEPVADVLASLSIRLSEIRSSMRSRDWSTLADVLAYDMPPESARCGRWLRHAAGQ